MPHIVFALSFPALKDAEPYEGLSAAEVLRAVEKEADKLAAAAGGALLADGSDDERRALAASVVEAATWMFVEVTNGQLAFATYRAPDGVTWKLERCQLVMGSPLEPGHRWVEFETSCTDLNLKEWWAVQAPADLGGAALAEYIADKLDEGDVEFTHQEVENERDRTIVTIDGEEAPDTGEPLHEFDESNPPVTHADAVALAEMAEAGAPTDALLDPTPANCCCSDIRGCPPCFDAAEALIGRRVRDDEDRVFEVVATDEKDGFPTVDGDDGQWANFHEVKVLPAVDVEEGSRA
jgi:hypothetical protein